MEKCIECGNQEFKKGIIEICTKCGETYSDEEAMLVIAKALDDCLKKDKKRIDKIIYDAVKNNRPISKEDKEFFDKWYKKEFEGVD